MNHLIGANIDQLPGPLNLHYLPSFRNPKLFFAEKVAAARNLWASMQIMDGLEDTYFGEFFGDLYVFFFNFQFHPYLWN